MTIVKSEIILNNYVPIGYFCLILTQILLHLVQNGRFLGLVP
jgi:hypothetical protein